MNKNVRIRVRRDFLRISRSGLYFRAGHLVVQCDVNDECAQSTASNDDELCSGGCSFRVGFTASKKVGNAVVRNRCKRRMRALADAVLPKIGSPGVDYVFIARESTTRAKWDILLGEAIQAVRFLNNKISAKANSKPRAN